MNQSQQINEALGEGTGVEKLPDHIRDFMAKTLKLPVTGVSTPGKEVIVQLSSVSAMITPRHMKILMGFPPFKWLSFKSQLGLRIIFEG